MEDQITAVQNETAVSPIRILHLEDEAGDRELIARLLHSSGLDCAITAVETRDEFLGALQQEDWQLILSDFALPDFDGFSALKLARQLAPQVPFLFVSGVIGEERAVETLKSGATDCVLKSRLERLAPAVRRALQEAEERRRLHETQTALFKSEERFRLLVQGIRDYAIYSVNLEGVVVSWNGGAERIFGYAASEAIGSPVRQFFRQTDLNDHCYERLLRSAEEQGRAQQEIWQVRKGGECFWGEVVLTPLPGIDVFAVITHDITERRLSLQERERTRQERARLQERFLSHISHELRTPLTTIVDFSSLLEEGTAGPLLPDQKEYLEIILRASNQLGVMVNSLLDLTRSDWRRLPVMQGCVAMEELIAQVCQNFRASAQGKRIQLRNSTRGPLPSAFADSSRIVEVLTNLIENAIKYSPEGSWVEVAATSTGDAPDFLDIQVRDNGPGIDPKYQGRVFERFFRVSEVPDSHPGGLGLGLFISREIVRAHGGTLWLEDAGPGCAFHFTVPVFRLERILAPLMTGRNLSAGAIAVLTVTIPEMPNCTAVDLDRYLRSVRETIGRCIHQSSDLILPLMYRGGRPRIHVVGFSKPDGVPRMLARIREELASSLELQPLEGQFEINSQIWAFPAGEIEDAAGISRRLAARIERALQIGRETGERDERRTAQSVGH